MSPIKLTDIGIDARTRLLMSMFRAGGLWSSASTPPLQKWQGQALFLDATMGVVHRGGLSLKRKTKPVAEITAHLKNGTSDKELMKKYGMSEKGLKRLFR